MMFGRAPTTEVTLMGLIRYQHQQGVDVSHINYLLGTNPSLDRIDVQVILDMVHMYDISG